MGDRRDVSSEHNLAHSIAPVAITATTTGSAVDLMGYNGATVFISAGVWTDGTHTFTITECATSGGSYTAVGASDRGTLPAAISGTAAASQAYRVPYTGSLRYVKVLDTVVSGTAGMVVSASVVRSLPVTAPISQ
jgi:hypothetical protein